MTPLGADESGCNWLVIGAGVVGLCTALRLRQAGHKVTLIDRSGVAAEASRGNAGALAYSDILPLASPGILRQAPRWLLDPLGPLSLPPAYLPRILPWLWRFWRASQPAQVAASTRAQAALMRLAERETASLLQSINALDLLHTDGNLQLYESDAEWRASLPGWQLRADHGVAFEHLHGVSALAALQPGLSPALVAATFVPGWQRIEDPLLLCQRVAQAFEQLGGRLRLGDAKALRAGADGIDVPLASGQTLRASRVVVASGA